MHLSDVQRQSGARRFRLPRDVARDGVHRGGTQAGLDCRNGQGGCQDDPERGADFRFAAFTDRSRKTLGLTSYSDQKSLKWNNGTSLRSSSQTFCIRKHRQTLCFELFAIDFILLIRD
jgi:hypothetical protein